MSHQPFIINVLSLNDAGHTGTQGPRGSKGRLGIPGPTGPDGLTGTLGNPGVSGPDGINRYLLP